MADVLFRFDTETAKAVQGLLRMAEAQAKTESYAAKQAKSLGQMEKMASGAGQALSVLASGFLGSSGVVAGIQGYIQAMEQASQLNRQFEQEVTGFLSLGDNIKFGKQLKDQILEMSNATGRTRQEIADLKFAAQSSAGNLSKDLQDELGASALDLTKLTGNDPASSLRLLVKSYQTYGDEVKDVTDLTNKLILAAEKGDMEFADMAARLPEVASAAKAVGINFNEVLAGLVALTQKQGNVEKAFTQMRNVLLQMEKAFGAGMMEDTGDFVTNISKINDLKSDELMEIFGMENISGAKDLAASTQEIASAMKDIETVGGNIAKEKIFERMSDPNYRASDTAAKVEQIMENNNLVSSPELAKRSNRDSTYKLEMDILKDQMHPLARNIPGVPHLAYGMAKAEDALFWNTQAKGGSTSTKRLGFLAEMQIKQAQMDEGTSPEDIALYNAQKRNQAARSAAGGGAGGNVTINIQQANFASPASALRQLNAQQGAGAVAAH